MIAGRSRDCRKTANNLEPDLAVVVLNSDSLVLSVDLEHPRKENTR